MEEKNTKTDPRQLGYARKYDSKHDVVIVRLEKGTKEKIAGLGYASTSSFIKLAVAEKLAREEAILGKKKDGVS